MPATSTEASLSVQVVNITTIRTIMVMLPPTKISAYPKLFSNVSLIMVMLPPTKISAYPKLFSNVSLITTSRFSFLIFLYIEDKKDFILIMQLFVAQKGRGIITFCLIIKH